MTIRSTSVLLTCFSLTCAATGQVCDREILYGEPELTPWTVNATRPLIAADVNHDGAPDLIGITQNGQTILVHLGNGDGTIGPAQSTGAGGLVESLLAADVNGDDILDLVCTYAADITFDLFVRSFLGAGDGTFTPQTGVIVSFSGGAAGGIAAADFDGDGFVDVANAIIQEGVFINFGNGDGTFSAVKPIDQGANPRDLEVADLNGDGAPDMVTVGNIEGKVTMYTNFDDGNANFGITSTLLPIDVLFSSLVIGDFDASGLPDVAVEPGTNENLFVLLNDGKGGLLEAEELPMVGRGVATADLDGDGALDIVLDGKDALSVAFGAGDGTFPTILEYPGLNQTPAIGDLPVADLDLDGDLDVITRDVVGVTRQFALYRNQCTLAPIISTQPAPLTFVDAGADVTLFITVDLGTPPIEYQWRRNGVPLANGGNVSGADTDTLTLDSVTFADTDYYDVVASNDLGSDTSDPALVSVRQLCYPDCNGDGILNILDFVCFQITFQAACP